MADIEHMVEELVHTYREVSEEQKKDVRTGAGNTWNVPKLRRSGSAGKFGAYCIKKCDMNVSRVMEFPKKNLSKEKSKNYFAEML